MDTEESEDPLLGKYDTANVLQDNDEPGRLLEDLVEKQADLLLLMKTNTRWMIDVSWAMEGYPYRMNYR